MAVTNRNLGDYFGATIDRPFHLGVGVIVLDATNQVYCLHYPKVNDMVDVFVLPTRTVRPNETLEAVAARCAKTEVGCEIELITYLGATAVSDVWWGELGTPAPMQKSVLYFLAKAASFDPALAQEELEKEKCLLETHPIDFLLEKMSPLQVQDGMRDWNHADILRRAQQWIATHPDLKSEIL